MTQFSSFYMPDRLRPDQVVSLREFVSRPLAAIERAIGFSAQNTTIKLPSSSTNTDNIASRAILVHCNGGHNQSPTLVLSYLLGAGLSLRQAYQLVFKSRPGIDPLPPYRRALLDLELSLSGGISTVNQEDHFHLHLTELMRLAKNLMEEEEAGKNDHNSLEHNDLADKSRRAVRIAKEMREKAIAKLLKEGLVL